MSEEESARTSTGTASGLSEEEVRRWLTQLRQPDRLATEPKLEDLLRAHGRLPISPSPIELGQAAAELLTASIEKLRPPEGAKPQEAMPYRVLRVCFVEGAKVFQAAGRLGVSERHLTRERTRAVRLLLAELEAGSRTQSRNYSPERVPAIRSFLRRDAEMQKLKRALDESHLVIVHGPPGSGKTSLVAEMASEMARQIPVFWYRFRSEVNTKLSAFLLELGDSLREDGSPDLADALERSLPDVDVSVATRLAIRSLGDQERLLVIDDFHLMDEDAGLRGFLEELVERLDQIRVVAVSQHRYLGLMLGQPVEVGPLSRSQAEDLLLKSGVTCEPEMVRAIHRWTGGNPHMLKLAASWMKDVAPDQVMEGLDSLADEATIRDFLLKQITALVDSYDLEILKGASVFRNRFNDRGLAFVVERSHGAVLDSSLRLERRYLATRNRDGTSAIFHRSVKDFVYSRLEEEEKRRLHKRAAVWFEQIGDEDEAAYHQRHAVSDPMLTPVQRGRRS